MTPTGVEALIRWRRPGRGVVEPEQFIPQLEESKLIVDVGAWVLREACAQAAGWQQEGRPMCLSVNVSALQLDTDALIDDVKVALAASGLAPEALTLEITETTLMTDAEETARRLRELKEVGVKIAVDDFGTGYSSLSHLRQFPVDVLKIDRSFVSQLAEGGENEILLHTLVQLGKALEIETTAEGIERPQDLTLIRDKECDNGQGFLFTRPLTAQDADSFFSSWSPNRRFEVRAERPDGDRVPVDGSLGPDAAVAGTDAP
jgi:EAL domain-containing protein (putative c-di-GMP-specific phosphodiesterase class I)